MRQHSRPAKIPPSGLRFLRRVYQEAHNLPPTIRLRAKMVELGAQTDSTNEVVADAIRTGAPRGPQELIDMASKQTARTVKKWLKAFQRKSFTGRDGLGALRDDERRDDFSMAKRRKICSAFEERAKGSQKKKTAHQVAQQFGLSSEHAARRILYSMRRKDEDAPYEHYIAWAQKNDAFDRVKIRKGRPVPVSIMNDS